MSLSADIVVIIPRQGACLDEAMVDDDWLLILMSSLPGNAKLAIAIHHSLCIFILPLCARCEWPVCHIRAAARRSSSHTSKAPCSQAPCFLLQHRYIVDSAIQCSWSALISLAALRCPSRLAFACTCSTLEVKSARGHFHSLCIFFLPLCARCEWPVCHIRAATRSA